MSTLIRADAQRSEGWWAVEFLLDGSVFHTQARRLDQVEAMVKDAAALITDQPEEDFDVTVVVDAPTYRAAVDRYRERARLAQEAEKAASAASREAVSLLRKDGLPLRDVATLMGISPQRASQLAQATGS